MLKVGERNELTPTNGLVSDVKDGMPRTFCYVCREFGWKHQRNPYGNEGSCNMQMNTLEDHNNKLLNKEAYCLQSVSKYKITALKPVYIKEAKLIHLN
ncbi:hypothetical protein MtrunA17_Chr1g0154541 [Medicago truncatula]|uniref:C17orf113 probable zinc finger domain-containing protein n=1 Tax=Medicago truncatula TaxID=3880 RepID=A0A396JM95_MEDTR|nr:hypothetical protein MtrunA17_Chr1g0154541 [Medicago truncatula]